MEATRAFVLLNVLIDQPYSECMSVSVDDPLIPQYKLLSKTAPATNLHAAAEIKSIRRLRFGMLLRAPRAKKPPPIEVLSRD